MNKKKLRSLKALSIVMEDFERVTSCVASLHSIIFKKEALNCAVMFRCLIRRLRDFDEDFLRANIPRDDRERLDAMRERLNLFLQKIKERCKITSYKGKSMHFGREEIRFILDKEEKDQAEQAS